MSEWSSYQLGALTKDVAEMRSDVKAIKSRLDEATKWLQRLALLIVLWGGGIIANLAPDKAGEYLVTLLKSIK